MCANRQRDNTDGVFAPYNGNTPLSAEPVSALQRHTPRHFEIAGIRHKDLTLFGISSSESLLPISSKSQRQSAGAVSLAKLVWATTFSSKTIHQANRLPPLT